MASIGDEASTNEMFVDEEQKRCQHGGNQPVGRVDVVENEGKVRRLEKAKVVVELEEEAEGEVVLVRRRKVFGLGISCFNRTSSSILCANRRVRVTSRIQTTRRKTATMVMIRDKNFFLRSLR